MPRTRSQSPEWKIRLRVEEKLALFVEIIRYIYPLYPINPIDYYRKNIARCVRSVGIQAPDYSDIFDFKQKNQRHMCASAVLCSSIIEENPFNIVTEHNIKFALIVLCLSVFDAAEMEIRDNPEYNRIRRGLARFSKSYSNNRMKVSIAIKESVNIIESFIEHNNNVRDIHMSDIIYIIDLIKPYVNRIVGKISNEIYQSVKYK